MTGPGEVATIVGAGPTGALLAILMQRRGLKVTLYDSRPDPRSGAGQSGRSINLALADRGIHALKSAGVFASIAGSLTTMRGRRIHELGAETLHLYGQRPSEVIYSVSRHRLNQALLDVAAGLPGIEMKFEHRLEDIDFQTNVARLRDMQGGAVVCVPMRPLIAADGAGSLTRRRMTESRLIRSREDDLAHAYKELSIPAGARGEYRMQSDALHIWPRGNFMLIALPNIDGSFTATLFLARQGPVSFEALSSPRAVEGFLREHFPDAFALMPDCVAEFQDHPTGFLGTVYAQGWHAGGSVALLGDAAHAIVPFHGQGMNCCFEDCLEFDACMARNTSWQTLFEEFYASRKANTDAIAALALENYLEMRDRVVDPHFRLQQMLALELERRHPRRFIPRYSMVMFHHEIGYAVARDRGLIQSRVLAELTQHATTLDEIDYPHADRLVERELAPI